MNFVKKLIGYALIALVCYYGYVYYLALLASDQKKQEDEEKQAQEAADTYAAQHPHATAELQQIAFKAAGNRNLPVYARNFKDVVSVTKAEWKDFNQFFKVGSSKGDDYATQVSRIERLSSKGVKSGIYKKEFDTIRSALLERINW